MIRTLLSWFRRKPTPPANSAYPSFEKGQTQTALLTLDQVYHDLLAKLKSPAQIDHITLQAAARLFFNVDLPTSLWRLRYTSESLMYFRIAQVHTVFEGKAISKIELSLSDEALNTSLVLRIDIRDVPELLVPVFSPTVPASTSTSSAA